MEWTPEAEAWLKRVPFWVRKRVRQAVEDWAASQGKTLITAADFLKAREELRDKAAETREGYAVETCFGGAGCKNALTDSAPLLRRVEDLLRKADLTSFLREKVGGPLKHHHQFRVAFSECPNACSRIHIADFGVHGRIRLEVEPGLCSFCESCLEVCEEEALRLTEAGPVVEETRCVACGACTRICPTGALREGERGYRILVGGKLGRRPRLATEILPLAREEEVLRILERVLRIYREENRRGERLGAIIERLGWEEFRKRVLA